MRSKYRLHLATFSDIYFVSPLFRLYLHIGRVRDDDLGVDLDAADTSTSTPGQHISLLCARKQPDTSCLCLQKFRRSTHSHAQILMSEPQHPPGEVIDWSIFNQILMMDEDPNERDFSKSIVENYFEQAESTFSDMDAALSNGDMQKLMRLGHFLKGSSASLGLIKVQSTCEEIQHVDTTPEEPGLLITRVRQEYSEAHLWLSRFFNPQ